MAESPLNSLRRPSSSSRSSRTDHTAQNVNTDHTVHTVPTLHALHTVYTVRTNLSGDLPRIRSESLHPPNALRTQVISRILADQEPVPPHRAGRSVTNDAVWGRGSLATAGSGRHAEAAD